MSHTMPGCPSLLLDAPLQAGPPSIRGRSPSPLSRPASEHSVPLPQSRAGNTAARSSPRPPSRPLRPPVPAGRDAAWRSRSDFHLGPTFCLGAPHLSARQPSLPRRPAWTYLVAAATAAEAAVTQSRGRPVPPPRPPSPQPRDPRLRHRRRGSEQPGPPPAEMAERIRAGRAKRGGGGASGRPSISGKSRTYSRGTGG